MTLLEAVVHRGTFLEALPSRCCKSAAGMTSLAAALLNNYMGVKAHGATEAARTQQHLLMQIGGHAGFGRVSEMSTGRHATGNPTRRDPRLVRLPLQRHPERVRN